MSQSVVENRDEICWMDRQSNYDPTYYESGKNGKANECLSKISTPQFIKKEQGPML